MGKIVEIIPNFSEGRNQDVIQGLVDQAQSVGGATLVDYSADPNHHRSVFTLVGHPEAIEDVAFKLMTYAAEHIDMTQHQGEHPRMGATDVCPFVPLKNISVEECNQIVHRLSQRVGDELGIPVYLYEESALQETRRNLAKIRKGEFEGMADKLKDPLWKPDFGPPEIHPKAGVTAIGVRAPLVAFNVNLDTDNLEIASEIAKRVRGSSGGFKYCKAMGVKLEDRNIVQVSMNMVNYRKTPLYIVFEAIRREAQRYGVGILESEIIGLAPAEALIDSASYYLQLNQFDFNQQIIENHLLKEM